MTKRRVDESELTDHEDSDAETDFSVENVVEFVPLMDGAAGERVEALQRKLNLPVTGLYRREVTAAVRVWQASHALSNTGIVDELTWLSIFEEE